MCKAIRDLIADGEERGEAQMGRLIAALLEEGKSEEALAVAKNADKREAYYRKYNIVK